MYTCPECGREMMVHELRNKPFKYKVVCHCCVFSDWVDSIEKFKTDGRQTDKKNTRD